MRQSNCEYFFLNKHHPPNTMLRSTPQLSGTSEWFQGLNCCKTIKYSVQFCTSAMGVCADSLTTIMGRKNRATTRYDENNSRFMFYSELDLAELDQVCSDIFASQLCNNKKIEQPPPTPWATRIHCYWITFCTIKREWYRLYLRFMVSNS